MEKLTDQLRKYLATASKEQLDKDAEELKDYLVQEPDGTPCALAFEYAARVTGGHDRVYVTDCFGNIESTVTYEELVDMFDDAIKSGIEMGQTLKED